MSDLGKVVLAKNIKINGRRVSGRECLIISEDQDKYYMLVFVDKRYANESDYEACDIIPNKKVSVSKLAVMTKDIPKEIIADMDTKNYFTTLTKLNNYQLSAGNYNYPFYSLKESIQGQLVENIQKIIKK